MKNFYFSIMCIIISILFCSCGKKILIRNNYFVEIKSHSGIKECFINGKKETLPASYFFAIGEDKIGDKKLIKNMKIVYVDNNGDTIKLFPKKKAFKFNSYEEGQKPWAYESHKVSSRMEKSDDLEEAWFHKDSATDFITQYNYKAVYYIDSSGDIDTFQNK